MNAGKILFKFAHLKVLQTTFYFSIRTTEQIGRPAVTQLLLPTFKVSLEKNLNYDDVAKVTFPKTIFSCVGHETSARIIW